MASQKLIVMVAFIMLLTFVEQTVTYSKCPSKFWTFRPQFRMEDREQGRKGGGEGRGKGLVWRNLSNSTFNTLGRFGHLS